MKIPFLTVIPFVLAACGGETSNPTALDAATDNGAAEAAVDAPSSDAPASDAPAANDAATDASAPEDVPVWVPDASSPMTPIEAPSETWTWVPFPDSACGNGTPAGVGVNLTRRSNRVVIYLQGGGGCWDAATCHLLNTASNLNTTYTAATFDGEIRSTGAALMFNRADARNPFRDASFVYVPYCTGDIHGGNRIMQYAIGGREYTTYHVGARNMESYLRRLSLTFPTADRVWLMGVSAGGFGAGLNWDRVQRAFPSARVDLLDDSGPPINPPAERYNAFKASWNIQFPPGCTGCADDLSNLLAFYRRTFPPPHRLGLLSYTRDGTISTYFGVTGPAYEVSLNAFLMTAFDPAPNFKYFVLPGTTHTMLGSLPTLRAASGDTLLDFVTAWANDGATWHNVHP